MGYILYSLTFISFVLATGRFLYSALLASV